MDFLTLVVQVLFIIPLGWLALGQARLQAKVDAQATSSYSKAETERMIALMTAPMENDMEYIKKEMSEIKAMLQKVLDGGK